MLHHYQRMFALQGQKQFSRAFGFMVRHAGHRFIQQQQFWVLHQQHADLQPLLLAVAQIARQPGHTVSQVNGVQHFRQPVALGRVQFEQHRGLDAFVGLQGQFQVLKYRELLKHRRFLKLAADAQRGNLGFVVTQQVYRAAKKYTARIGTGLAGDDVHHRRLAGAIGADDAAQFARGDVERQVVDGLEAVKTHVHVFKVEDAPVGRVHLGRGHQARKPGGTATGLGVAGLRLLLADFQPARAFFQQFGRHADTFFIFLTKPTTPLGKNSVTAINSSPRKYSQNSG